jgi:hypothetical protein
MVSPAAEASMARWIAAVSSVEVFGAAPNPVTSAPVAGNVARLKARATRETQVAPVIGERGASERQLS